jgi:hypothetical protein
VTIPITLTMDGSVSPAMAVFNSAIVLSRFLAAFP